MENLDDQPMRLYYQIDYTLTKLPHDSLTSMPNSGGISSILSASTASGSLLCISHSAAAP